MNRFRAWQTLEGLQALDAAFQEHVASCDPEAATWLAHRRGEADSVSPPTDSDFLVRLAPWLSSFLADTFGICDEAEALKASLLSHDPVFAFREAYVIKQAKRLSRQGLPATDWATLNTWLSEALVQAGGPLDDVELAVAQLGVAWLDDPATHEASIERLVAWCVHALVNPEARATVHGWVMFRLPEKRDASTWVRTQTSDGPTPDVEVQRSLHQRQREGFDLTDPRMGTRAVQWEADYCVYCHTTAGDFCAKGFPVKKTDPSQGLRRDVFDRVMTGCPLEEHISEMNWLRRHGDSLAALAVVMVNNPLCPATGHRICNDCMKACIYQKQDPVNIPEIETRVLTDVLGLPWGVEIFDLLTRWNPLRATQWLPQPGNGYRVLVMGMGPAGFTLAYHLLMEGCQVVGMDGLKLEPFPSVWLREPIRDVQSLNQPLSQRTVAGFGGVAEYGITVRWDKNFLTLVRLCLERRAAFQCFGGVRFGGTMTVERAWSLGFDHLALAVGAGLPRALPIPGSMRPGMRQANDFLMALQLTGAAKDSSLAKLWVRLPALVVGGGLTAVDTATECQAYYLQQVQTTSARLNALIDALGEAAVRERFAPSDWSELMTQREHARAYHAARKAAQARGDVLDVQALIQGWGGVHLVYRKRMVDAPAYQLNPEELAKALDEGIGYLSELQPVATTCDDAGWIDGLVCQRMAQDPNTGAWGPLVDAPTVTLPAKTVLVATGAQPNVAYAFEHPGRFERERFEYRTYAEATEHGLHPVPKASHCKDPGIGPFTSYSDAAGHRVTFLGDTHPDFHGSVVKAIASARYTYPSIMAACRQHLHPSNLPRWHGGTDRVQAMRWWLTPTLVASASVGDGVWRLEVRAPLHARAHQPGQFYRLQALEAHAPLITRDGLDTRLQADGLVVFGHQRPEQPDRLVFYVVGSPGLMDLVQRWPLNMPLALMGPTGVRSKRYAQLDAENVIVLVVDRVNLVQVLEVGQALRQSGATVVALVCMAHTSERYEVAALNRAVHDVVWCVGASYDQQIDAVQAWWARWAKQGLVCRSLRHPLHNLHDVRWFMGSGLLSSLLPWWRGWSQQQGLNVVRDTAQVFGPMQCMLKGVCAQCLQWQVDPATGERTKAVYACSWQEQPSGCIDLNHLEQRDHLHGPQDTLTALWLDHITTSDAVEAHDPSVTSCIS